MGSSWSAHDERIEHIEVTYARAVNFFIYTFIYPEVCGGMSIVICRKIINIFQIDEKIGQQCLIDIVFICTG